MSTARKGGRSKRFSEFEEKTVKDFDPENEAPDDDGESGSEDSADELAGTEHYVAVGKSKLRQKEPLNLGPEYRGARVSRAALEDSGDDDGEGEASEEEEDEEFADPETADLEADHDDAEDDFEIGSDDALCESDDENLKDFVFRGSSKPKKPLPKENGRILRRPTAADFMSSSGGEYEEGDEDSEGDEDEEFGSEDGSGNEFDEMEEDDEEEGSEEESESEGEDEDEEDEDEEKDDEEESDEDNDGEDNERSNLKKIINQGQKRIVEAMSQAAKADADKGQAVRVQRRAFDTILNLRIRLQKALIASNTFNMVETPEKMATKPYQAAEEAAVKLWNTIDSVRYSFLPEATRAKIGEKRKRAGIEADTPSAEIWASMQTAEEAAHAHRRKVLDKWSERVKKSTTGGASTRNLVKNDTQTLLSTLDGQLVSSDRLIKKARTPRSCAPAQAAKKVEEDTEIYDDADFYQLLLKELVDQRSADNGAAGEAVTTVRWAALKEAKVRKQVDRRASKGRKLRYTVHEKLQNFMAPEDRRRWEEPTIDRLFGTLFGQKLALDEEDKVSDDEDEEMGGVNVEEEQGLKLFRS